MSYRVSLSMSVDEDLAISKIGGKSYTKDLFLYDDVCLARFFDEAYRWQNVYNSPLIPLFYRMESYFPEDIIQLLIDKINKISPDLSVEIVDRKTIGSLLVGGEYNFKTREYTFFDFTIGKHYINIDGLNENNREKASKFKTSSNRFYTFRIKTNFKDFPLKLLFEYILIVVLRMFDNHEDYKGEIISKISSFKKNPLKIFGDIISAHYNGHNLIDYAGRDLLPFTEEKLKHILNPATYTKKKNEFEKLFKVRDRVGQTIICRVLLSDFMKQDAEKIIKEFEEDWDIQNEFDDDDEEEWDDDYDVY